MLTAGGHSGPRRLKTVEMIHLNGNGIKNCPVDDLPEEVQKHSAVNSKVGPIVCGGATDKGDTQKCHRLIIANGSWEKFDPLNIARTFFSMTEINDLLVSIGDAKSSSSYEHINVLNETKWIEKAMPFSIYYHCSTKINQSTILITGGKMNGKVSENNLIICFQNDVYTLFDF